MSAARAAHRPVKFRIEDIQETEKQVTDTESLADVNERLEGTGAGDFRFSGDLEVSVAHYRSGREIFFQGAFRGSASGICGRCLEPFPLEVRESFRFVFKPAEEGDFEDEPGIFGYSGEEIDLTDPIRQEILVSLPTRPLCSEGCRGLCPTCGGNRNVEACACREEWVDPRLEVLRRFKGTSA